MSYLMKKENLFIRVALGFVIGALLGIFMPGLSKSIKILGDVYMTLIKMMIIPVLICAVMGGIINIKDTSSLRRIGLKTVALYVLMFVVSAVLAFGVAYLIRPGLNVVLENQPVWEGQLADTTVSGFLSNIFPNNIFAAMSKGDILPTIIFVALLVVALVSVGDAGNPVKEWFNSMSAAIFKVLSMVMEFSPIGVMSLIAYSLAEYGTGIFSALGKYILTAWLASILVLIVVMILPVLIITKTKPAPLLKSMGKISLMTLSTTSSAATLPTTIRVSIDDLGAPEGISNFTLPLGCTINMCGGAVSFSVLALFVADFYGLNLPIPTLMGMIVVSTMINMAAPGIPGGGIVLGASFLATFGLPFDLMGPISAFYRLLDMAYTTLNVEGDLTANLLISYSEGEWNPSMAKDKGQTTPAVERAK